MTSKIHTVIIWVIKKDVDEDPSAIKVTILTLVIDHPTKVWAGGGGGGQVSPSHMKLLHTT